jgi:hypothetical protein
MGAPMQTPRIEGWHTEAEEAAERGVSLQHLRKQCRAGIGPMPTKFGRRPMYPDGGNARYLEKKHAAEQAERGRPPTRGRRPAPPVDDLRG